MFIRSLSARLLVLTIFFVMLGEVLIFVPSVARYRMTYFENHIAAAHVATLALIASPNGRLDQALTDELLAEVGVHAITLRRPSGTVQMLDSPSQPQAEVTFTLGGGNVPIWIERSFETLFSHGHRVMKVIGASPFEPDTKVEIVLDEAPLRAEMWQFGGRIFQLSIMISLLAAVLVYLSLQWLLVRPMRRIIASMTLFGQDPEDASRVIVPRGGKSLVARVQTEARVPVFAHLEGVCHVYVDRKAKLAMAKSIVLNAKMRRTGVCGAAETLLVDRADAPRLLKPLVAMLLDAGCEIRGDAAVQAVDRRVKPASEADWGTEYLDAILTAGVVDGVDGAIAHIERYGSHHTDAIVTEDRQSAEKFLREVDSAIVLHNASTQFADGGEFGFGAEIGIATGRLHARGPVGVEQLTSFKYRVHGSGQTRP